MEEKKFVLRHGIHKGTFVSRDIGYPESFDTYEAAFKAYEEHKKFYKSVGYLIWFAEIVASDGTVTTLDTNPYY